MLLVLLKELVNETFLVLSISRLVEIVHVQLAHERREIIVFEILWQDVLCEGVRVLDAEAVRVLVPKHDVLVLTVVHDFVRLRQEVRHLVAGWHAMLVWVWLHVLGCLGVVGVFVAPWLLLKGSSTSDSL
jgi:hypothetical protein